MDLEAYVDVVPWLLFVVVDRRAGLGLVWAAVTAMACGAAIAAWSHWRRRRSPVGLVAVGTFAALTVVATVVNGHERWFEPVLRASSVSMLAAAALLSLRRRPLSEAYTVDRVAPLRREEPAFAIVNARITTTWAIAAMLVAASFAVMVGATSPVALTVFDWILPIVIISGAVKWAAAQWAAYLLASEGADATTLGESSLGRVPGGPARGPRLLPGTAQQKFPHTVPARGTASPDASISYLPGVHRGH